ncbi:MAG TPA: ATP-binding protein [Limnochordia bacterium]|nr:ATP-binding protein [Limnochordia bacterium]
MSVLHAFFETNFVVLRFGQGLVFFLMGFAIWLTLRHSTDLTMGRSLHLLGTFGVTQGFADWGQAFVPFQRTFLSPDTLALLQGAATLLLGLSYTLLLWFALSLLADTYGVRERRRWLVTMGLGVWLLCLCSASLWVQSTALLLSYGLAFPGAALSVWALLAQREELRRLDMELLSRELSWLAAALAVYSLVAGLVGPAGAFFPANILNEQRFFDLTGFPIHALRGLSGLAMAFFTVRLLEVFTIETRRRLEAADRLHSVSDERDRIARELHDSIIQSLYGVGLSLEAVRADLGDDHRVGERLDKAVEQLGQTIGDIRKYILDLKAQEAEREALGPTLRALVNELRARYDQAGQLVQFDVQLAPVLSGTLTYEELSHIAQIVREAIGNAVRHGHATQIEIRAQIIAEALHVIVRDNGRGFDVREAEAKEGWGLKNMRQRALLVGGTITFSSRRHLGSRVHLEMPIAEREPVRTLEAGP